MKLDDSHIWILTRYKTGTAAECHSCGARSHWPLAQMKCPSKGYRPPMPETKVRATEEEVYEAMSAMENTRDPGSGYRINHRSFEYERRGTVNGFKY